MAECPLRRSPARAIFFVGRRSFFRHLLVPTQEAGHAARMAEWFRDHPMTHNEAHDMSETATAVQERETLHAVNIDPAIPDFVPISLDQIFMKAMIGLPVYLERDQAGTKRYHLHCGESARFSDFHRRRLQERAVRFILVPRESHLRYREVVEEELEAIAADEALPLGVRAGLIYEMAFDLLREWMSGEPENHLQRLESVARAASAFITREPKAFGHFYTCSRHDDRIATHMVNVGIWMACLAFAMDTKDREELKNSCLAGFLLDSGIRTLSQKMLLKSEELTAEERLLLYGHPVHGMEFLKAHGIWHEGTLRAAREHHERLDGSGYPAGLKKEQIHPLSQMAAVVDSFEAMTSPRPYKQRVKTLAEATAALQADAAKYDQPIVEALIGLLKKASEQGVIRESVNGKGDKPGRRAHQRFGVDCPMQLRALTNGGGSWVEGPALPGKMRNISKTGVGVQLKEPLDVGTYVRLNTKGKGTMQDKLFEGQVMRCKKLKDAHEIGIRLCAPGK
jgi:HD-GYP domain-containing protein (c-di-GMP phosphodiesterase class II)